jgi:Fibronectin type III domain
VDPRVQRGEYTTDRAASLAISDDGSRIAVVGDSSGWLLTVVYDAQGNQVGQILREDLIFARDAAFGPENELYVGTTSWTPQTGDRMTIVKLAANGSLLFIRSYTDGEFVYRMAVDSQGNVVAAGVKDVYMNWVTLKVKPDGDRLWSQVYDGFTSNDERPFFLTIDRFDDIYVTGEGGPAPPGPTISNLQATTVKYSSSGAQEWVVLNGESARGVAVRIGSDLVVYVQGQGEMLTVRYDQEAASQAPPRAPSGLTVTGRTRSQISLRWVNNTPGQDGVQIQRCRGTGCTKFVQIAQVSGTSTTYVDVGLTRNTTYRYRVRAFNESGNSSWSNIVTTKTRQ